MKINKKNKSCRKKEKSDLGAAILFLAPNFIGFLIFTLIPMVFSLVMSLYDWPLTGTHTFVGLKNFITLFTKDILFFKVMKNTFVYVIAYVAWESGFNLFFALQELCTNISAIPT